MINDLLSLLNEQGIQANELQLKPEYLAEIITLVDEQRVNTPTGKSLLEKVEKSGKAPIEVVDEEGLGQVSDSGELSKIAEKIIRSNPDQVASYQGGKESLIGWFVGQAMAASKGKADPSAARTIFEELLKS
jgi:aspartyl-tRNA(Asn)/glutamyl-tRNA(Gln) amidotransferase subunit B